MNYTGELKIFLNNQVQRLLFLCLICLSSLSVEAQFMNNVGEFFKSKAYVHKPNNTILFMKDGSLYLGNQINQTQENFLLELTNLDTIQVKQSNIKKKITSDRYHIYRKGRYHPIKGIFMHADYGILTGDGQGSSANIGVGYRLNKYFDVKLGIGIALHQVEYQFSLYNAGYIPKYIELVYNLNGNRFRIMTFSRFGFANSLESDFNDNIGGYYIEPGVGFNIPSKNYGHVQLIISQYIQNTELSVRVFDITGATVTTQADLILNRLSIRIAATLL